MAPNAATEQCDPISSGDVSMTLLEMANTEIERIRRGKKACRGAAFHAFPPACTALLRNIEGNHRCVDCGEINPEWAAVSYGALLCLLCSGRHRSLGVQTSCVRSIVMDDWSLEEILSVLEGGNAQLRSFFERHALTADTLIARQFPASLNNHANQSKSSNNSSIQPDNVAWLRYKTKAARFYKQQMQIHVQGILRAGRYRGREMSRQLRQHHRPSVERRNTTVE